MDLKQKNQTKKVVRSKEANGELFVRTYSNFRGRKTDLTETLSYHLAAVTSLAHLSVAL